MVKFDPEHFFWKSAQIRTCDKKNCSFAVLIQSEAINQFKTTIMNIKIVDYGICKAIGETKKDNVPGSTTGYFLLSDDMEFVEKTDLIHPTVGLSFGISYQFEIDSEEAELVDFVCRIRHPKLVNPATKEQFTETTEEKDCYSDELGYDFYTFELDWEMQLGEWIFEIIYDDKIMCSKTFTLKE